SDVENWRRCVIGDETFVDVVLRSATEASSFFRHQSPIDILRPLNMTTHCDQFRIVMTLVEMREPIMGHKLDPKSREDVDVRSRLIIAPGARQIVRRSATIVALFGGRLATGK